MRAGVEEIWNSPDTKTSMHLKTKANNSCSDDTVIVGVAALVSKSLHFPAFAASNPPITEDHPSFQNP